MVPSLDDVMDLQFCGLAMDVHVSPESVDVQMFPSSAVAASLVPSLDDVINAQFFVLALDVQVSPESVDVQMLEPQVTAASLVPSLDDVMPFQSRKYPVGFTSVHVEALTEASEANKSNAASRTRSIGFRDLELVDDMFRAAEEEDEEEILMFTPFGTTPMGEFPRESGTNSSCGIGAAARRVVFPRGQGGADLVGQSSEYLYDNF